MNLTPPDWIPRWADFVQAIQDGKSTIVHGSRYYMQGPMLRLLLDKAPEWGFSHRVHLRADQLTAGLAPDWVAMGRLLVEALQVRSFGSVREEIQIRSKWSRWLRERAENERLLVALDAGPSQTAAARFEIVCLLEELAGRSQERMVVAVFDDYSLYHYESWRTQGASRWAFNRIYLRPSTAHEIAAALSRVLPDLSPTSSGRTAAAIEGVTGGHPALVFDVIADIAARRGHLQPKYFKETVITTLEATHVLESTRRSLLQDGGRLVARAMELHAGGVTVDTNDPALQTLRMLGVVQWTSLSNARLSPGVIASLVRGLHQGDAAVRHGTVPRLLAGPPAHGPGDLAVVHLSDLHVGASFGYALPDGHASGFRTAERDLAAMVAGDLESLGIEYVDALVVSGDLTCLATEEEFNGARHVLEGLMRRIGVDWDRVILVAGNHDIRWNAPEGEPRHPVSGASRHQYEQFRSRIGRTRDPEAELTVIRSRDGRRALRVLSLDSNFVEGPTAGGVGFVSMEALAQAESLLRAADVQGERTLTWIVVHHHVLPVASTSSHEAFLRKTSVLANAPALLSLANRCDAELILHGHQHQPLLTVARRWPVDRAAHMRPLVVAAAGSIGCSGAELGALGRNHYFIHRRRDSDVLIHSRMTGDEGLGWVTHGDLVIPLE